MILRASILTLILAASAAAQSGTFDLQLGAKSIGRSTYTVAKAKQGYKVSDRVSYHINGVESDTSYEFKLSDTYMFLEGGATSSSTQMHNSYTPNKSRTDMVMGSVQAGQQDSRHLEIKPDFVILPAYDAGAAQAVLLLAVTHPTEKNLYNVVVPASGGGSGSIPQGQEPGGAVSGAGPRPGMGNSAYDALWSKGSDAQGTLDGKPVTLHRYTLTSGKNTWTFYADDANTLMQCDVSMLRASYVRAKFKLDVTP